MLGWVTLSMPAKQPRGSAVRYGKVKGQPGCPLMVNDSEAGSTDGINALNLDVGISALVVGRGRTKHASGSLIQVG